jgi:hypothetical protein
MTRLIANGEAVQGEARHVWDVEEAIGLIERRTLRKGIEGL